MTTRINQGVNGPTAIILGPFVESDDTANAPDATPVQFAELIVQSPPDGNGDGRVKVEYAGQAAMATAGEQGSITADFSTLDANGNVITGPNALPQLERNFVSVGDGTPTAVAAKGYVDITEDSPDSPNYRVRFFIAGSATPDVATIAPRQWTADIEWQQADIPS